MDKICKHQQLFDGYRANQPGERNTSGHICTVLRAGRNVGLRNARYNLTTSMQSICIFLTLIRQLMTTMVQKKRVKTVGKPNAVAIGSTHKTCQALYVHYAQCIAWLVLGSVLYRSSGHGCGLWPLGYRGVGRILWGFPKRRGYRCAHAQQFVLSVRV